MKVSSRRVTARLVALCVLLLGGSAVAGDAPAPTLALWGPVGRSGQPASPLGRQMMAAARLAIEYGRDRLGVDARLVQSSEEGLWGKPSNGLVDMIYRERAVAVIGPVDPAAAHVGLQLATRAQVPLVVPAAPDATLTSAGTPWIFSLLPGERARAAAVGRALRRWRCRSARVLCAEGRAGKTGYAALEAEAAVRGIALSHAGTLVPSASEVEDESDPDHRQRGCRTARWTALLSPHDEAHAADATILWLDPSLSESATHLAAGFGPQSRSIAGRRVILSVPLSPSPTTSAEGWLAVSPVTSILSAPMKDPLLQDLQVERLRRAVRTELGLSSEESVHPIALATFDAVKLVLEAIKARGADRSAVRDYLAGVRTRGLTGSIAFRPDGSRDVELSLLRYTGGRWAPD